MTGQSPEQRATHDVHPFGELCNLTPPGSALDVIALARRLLDYEATSGTSLPGDCSAMFSVCERLRVGLTPLIGAIGFRALLARALVLSADKVPWLHGITVHTDGSLDGIAQLKAQLTPRVVARGESVLVYNVLDLLVVFIGDALLLALLQDIWPGATLEAARTIRKGRRP